MSSALSQLLGKPEAAVAKFIKEVEVICGYPSEDVRLLVDLNLKLKNKVRQLDLDPKDTTNRELYYTLRSKIDSDNTNFSRQLGLTSGESAVNWLTSLPQYIGGSWQVFCLKKAALKKLISDMPPKNLMKQLNYRSVDSLIKREEPAAILAVAKFSESSTWWSKFQKSLKKLKVSDFQYRDVEVIPLSELLSEISTEAVAPVLLTGSVVLNQKAKFQQAGLFATIRVLEAIKKLKDWSLAIENKKFGSDFSKTVADNFNHQPHGLTVFGGLMLHPHHLLPAKASIAKLSDISPVINWWRDNDFLGLLGKNRPVSLSLHDILEDHLKNTSYKDHKTTKLHKDVWQQLLSKYLKHPAFREMVESHLDPEPALVGNQTVEPITKDMLAGAI